MEPLNASRKTMSELLWVVGFIAVWLLLQAWILPKLGVPS
jgi:hypothetical protein